jgi:chromosome segregation ATPase
LQDATCLCGTGTVHAEFYVWDARPASNKAWQAPTPAATVVILCYAASCFPFPDATQTLVDWQLGSNQNTKKLLDDLHTSQLQLSSCMQQIKYMSAVSRTASQQHSRKVAALHEQLQAAMDRVQVLEADLAGTRLAMTSKLLAGQRSQQQKGSIDDGGEGDADDQQQVVQKQGTTVATQAASAAKGAGTPKSSTAAQLPRRLWDFEQCEGAAKEDRPTGDGEDSCDGRKAASVQVAELTELLQQARSDVAAPEAELAAARQQAGQACGSAVFARQQVKTLSGQLQEAVEKIVQLENEAAVAKQQAVQATNELQALREASAAAAAAHAATMEVAQVERQCSNASVDQEKAMLRQQLEQEQSNGLQLQAQLKAATEKVNLVVVSAPELESYRVSSFAAVMLSLIFSVMFVHL